MSENTHLPSIQFSNDSGSKLSVDEPKSHHTDCHVQVNSYSDSVDSNINDKEVNRVNTSISRPEESDTLLQNSKAHQTLRDSVSSSNNSENENNTEKAQCSDTVSYNDYDDGSSRSPFHSHDQPNELFSPKNISPSGSQKEMLPISPKGSTDLDIDLNFVSYLPVDNSSIVQSKPIYEATTWPTGKDGGYSWVIVSAVFIINVIAAGYIKAFGVLLLAIHDYFPDTSNFSLGLVMSLQHGCRGLMAPLMGAISVMIGARKCVTLGVLLLCTGLLLGVFCTNVYQLAFTIGAMAGAGICMSETPGVIVVNQYFESLRSTANGLRTAGNPLGGMLFPLFYVPFLQNFGLKGTYIMISGVALQMCVMGFLLRSFHVHKRHILQHHLKQSKGEYDINDLEDKMRMENSEKKMRKKKPLDFQLLKNPVFLLFIAMNLGLIFVLPNSIYYSALYAKEIGLSPWEISIMLSYYSGLDFICRLLCGYLTDLKIYKKRHAFSAGLFLAGIGLFLVPLTYNMWTLMAALSLNALGFAYYYVLIAVLLADQFGEDSLASTWGFFRMSQGIGFFITPPLIGLMADASGSLTLPFIWMGFMMMLPIIFFVLQPAVGKLTGIEVIT